MATCMVRTATNTECARRSSLRVGRLGPARFNFFCIAAFHVVAALYFTDMGWGA